VIAFTGASGRQHGYADGWAADGVYRYFGEGQFGDMSWKGGNLAIRDHATNGEELLLFQTLGDGNVRFVGEFVCAGYDLEPAPDGTGAMRQAIVFNLVPASDLEEGTTPSRDEDNGTPDLQTLRRRALEAVSTPAQADRAAAKHNVYERSREIRAYVLARAWSLRMLLASCTFRHDQRRPIFGAASHSTAGRWGARRSAFHGSSLSKLSSGNSSRRRWHQHQ
jgi:5-methylcytosine-specific restriction protein A